MDSQIKEEVDENHEEYQEDLDKIDEYSFGTNDPKNDSGLISRFIFYWGYRIIKLADILIRLYKCKATKLRELKEIKN